MIEKAKVRTGIFIALNEKRGIEKDIEDTALYVQEYIFKKLVFRVMYLFLLCCAGICIYSIKEVILDQDLFSKEFFSDIFTKAICYSFIISGIYAFLGGLVYRKEYLYKNLKVENYYNLKKRMEESLED